MADERRRRQQVPVVVAILAYALVMAEAVTATTTLVLGDRWDWGRFWLWFFLALLYPVVAQAVARRIPEAQRQSAEDDETARAMSTGLLPPDADPETWRARIRRQGRESAVLWTLCAIVCVAAAVLTAAAAHLNNDDDPVLWTLAVVALLLAPLFFWLLVRDRRREQRLLTRL